MEIPSSDGHVHWRGCSHVEEKMEAVINATQKLYGWVKGNSQRERIFLQAVKEYEEISR